MYQRNRQMENGMALNDLPQELLVCTIDIYEVFFYYHWIDTSVVRLFVSESIMGSVVSILALKWFIRYIYYRHLQFLNNVIINKRKVLLPQSQANFWYPVWFICSQRFLNDLVSQSFNFECT